MVSNVLKLYTLIEYVVFLALLFQKARSFLPLYPTFRLKAKKSILKVRKKSKMLSGIYFLIYFKDPIHVPIEFFS